MDKRIVEAMEGRYVGIGGARSCEAHGWYKFIHYGQGDGLWGQAWVNVGGSKNVGRTTRSESVGKYA